MSDTALELKSASALGSPAQPSAIQTCDLPRLTAEWLLDCECRLHSKSTLDIRQLFLKNLNWFLTRKGHASCGLAELRAFFAYLVRGHEEPGGRWGNRQQTKPLRPISIKDYYFCLRGFFGWLVADGFIDSSPMERIPAPVARTAQKPPLTPEQVQAVLQAAKNGPHPKRDEAMPLLLLDTGMRSSEICSLRVKDINFPNRRCEVLGKGNKYRTVFFGRNASRALSQYLRAAKSEADAPLFLADRGKRPKAGLTRSGLQQIVRKLGVGSGIKASLSPHAFRRTFAVEILKNGANVFSLREMLGHTNLQMTQKYLLLAQADVEAQHRQFSPADRLKTK